jgi:hypothetical protein
MQESDDDEHDANDGDDGHNDAVRGGHDGNQPISSISKPADRSYSHSVTNNNQQSTMDGSIVYLDA